MSEKIYDDDDGDDNDHDDHNYETIMLKVVQYISCKCCRCVSTVIRSSRCLLVMVTDLCLVSLGSIPTDTCMSR